MISIKRSRSLAIGMPLAFLMITLGMTAREFMAAQDNLPKNPPARPGAGRTAMPNKYLVLPGLEPLSLESVQQEVGLTADQKQQLKKLSDAFMAEMSVQQANMQREMQALHDRPEEEQEKKPRPWNNAWTSWLRSPSARQKLFSPVSRRIQYMKLPSGSLSPPV